MRNIPLVLLAFCMVVYAEVVSASTPSKFELQRSLIRAYNQGLSGAVILGDQITPDPMDPSRFKVNLLLNHEIVMVGEWTFCEKDGEYMVIMLTIPIWYLEEARTYAKTDETLRGAVDAQTGAIAYRFAHWLDSQPSAVRPQPGSGRAVPEDLQTPLLGLPYVQRGRLVAVIVCGWSLLLEARLVESEWKIEVIAFERA